MTILFQEYFHPDDLELAVPMVAPISFGRNDERYSLFLAEIGTKECRDKLDASMLGALNRKLELADVYNPANETERLQNANDIGELIIDFPWSYWQNYGDPYCQFIPPGTASAKDLAGFFVDNILPEVNAPNHKPRPIDRQDDPDVAYDYQAYTQLGFPLSYPAGHLQRMVDLGYLSAYRKNQLEQDSDLFGDYPWVSSPTFDPQPMLEVDAWLRSDAKDIIAVYGKFDPWSAGKITVNTAKNSRVYVANASHSAFLTDLNDADYTAVRNRILSIDTRERALSSTPFAIPKATEAQRETLRKLLRQEL